MLEITQETLTEASYIIRSPEIDSDFSSETAIIFIF